MASHGCFFAGGLAGRVDAGALIVLNLCLAAMNVRGIVKNESEGESA